MSSGKLRRERSGSRERYSRKEGDKRSDAASDVPELNEEEYDEEWEHEWEDIDEIDRSSTKYHKPYGKNQNQKWRGRGQQRGQLRGQNRFNRWDHRNRPGSDHGSDSNRRTGRQATAHEEEENLDMPPGEEMTNLKVKIQDGKRFAQPDEVEEFDHVGGMRNQPKFSRGRGSRGYYGAGRERWPNKFKRSAESDLVDCREVLNRRKRHYSDQGECDLREKLLKKDADLGDLREIIDSRDPGAADLRDMIEPPDMNFMDEFTEDVVGEVDMDEDISLRIRNEYYSADLGDHGRVERQFEVDAEHFEYGEEREVDAIPNDDIPLRDESPPHQEDYQQDKWRNRRGRSRERSFGQGREWTVRSKRDSLPENDWHGPGPESRLDNPREDRIIALRGRSPRGPISPDRRSRDLSRNRSRERIRSPLPRNMRNRSFERVIRSREPSWERERSFEQIPSRERVPNARIQRETRGSFEGEIRLPERDADRKRPFSSNRVGVLPVENTGMPPMKDERRRVRSPPPQQERGRERNRARMRSISPEASRMRSSERIRRSQERSRGRRSISAERGRGAVREGDRSMEREGIRNIGRERERNWNAGRNENRNMGQERNRSIERGRIRSLSRDRNSSFDREKPRNFDQERKHTVGQEAGRNSRWNRSRSRETMLRLDRGVSPGREGERGAHWAGPRTPSAESFRGPGWERQRSPVRNRDRSPVRERSRSRGRPPAMPIGQTRDHSRGRSMDSRSRDQKDIKPTSRTKEQERREKLEEQSRRRAFEPSKPQDIQSSRPREPSSLRSLENKPGPSSKMDRNRKREHEENSSKEQARNRPRSPEHRSQQEKPTKKTPQMLVEEFKQRFIRETVKPNKFDRRDEYTAKQGRGNSGQDKKLGGGHNQNDSREWENIRDFQERRTQPAVGLPFLDESRRRENSSCGDIRQQEGRGSRNLIIPFVHDIQDRMLNADHQKKNQSVGWQNQNLTQLYNHSEEDRHRASRWGSPGRRDKPSDHLESHKSASHSTQSAANTHHPSSNGKAGGDYWRNLPSLGESLWNKPRSDLSINPARDSRDSSHLRSPTTKSALPPREVIFVRGLARDITEMDIRKDISNCGLWPKDVRIVYDNEGLSRGLSFITFNSVDEASRWMDVRKGVLNLRPHNHAPMDYSNPVSKDWECIRCHTTNFKHRTACYQCNRAKDDCLDGWEETCPYPTHSLLLRGLNPLTSTAEVVKALKPRMIAQARLDGVKMGVDMKGRPRSVCFVQLTSVVDSMSLHKSLVNEPLMIDNCQVVVAYCQLDKLPPMESSLNLMHSSLSVMPGAMQPTMPLSLHTRTTLPTTNNIPVVPRAPAAIPAPPKPTAVGVSSTSIRAMLEGNYSEKDIPTLAQYCASAYAKNPQEQVAFVRYYTKIYQDKLVKNQTGGK